MIYSVRKPSENDYSVGVLVTYGNIKYVTSGDLDGVWDYESNGKRVILYSI